MDVLEKLIMYRLRNEDAAHREAQGAGVGLGTSPVSSGRDA